MFNVHNFCHNFNAASPGFIKQVHNPNDFKRVTHSKDVDFGHIELSNDNPISEKFRNENDVTYEVDAFVHVVLGKV
jgi:hypothetical protein